ncbi:hypothetical protein LV84_03161 [Algoriphagus ratkowskyi]|uniref:Tetratricopeptide repeat protein n=1 Tax=Algoriphagus ratkowskyi TaxID=57028 RepID=A0A2W7RCM0_9BACT|nr:hypothetical protein [Algoriphagus ratkowskyi]PZX53437.1 hypothetical protein LV84_03161 [Algoriphagus ratkowskyi]TXD76522.1 hypothetical protein ESW18_16085 [Algoriphagus ratkowskyi]
MNREQLQKDIFPAELILKLFGNETKLPDKITLINDYIEGVKGSYDAEVLKIIQNNQIAHIYWEAGNYEHAIAHFEIVVENMEPEDKPSLYFLALNLLIRSNRMLSKIEKALTWSIQALNNSHIATENYRLINLKEYAELLTDTEENFDDKYLPVIKSIIDFYGIPIEVNDPIDTVKLIHQMHSYWAKKLTVLEAKIRKSDPDMMIREYEEYASSCEIEWYRNYAENSLERLKNKKSQD